MEENVMAENETRLKFRIAAEHYELASVSPHINAVLKKVDGMWHAYFISPGKPTRYAGIWDKKRDAIKELNSVALSLYKGE